MRKIFVFVSILSMLSLFSGYADAGLLHSAASTGDINTLSRLLNEGADIDAKDETDWTPLLLAAYMGHIEVVRLLLGKGADIDAKNNYGDTSLHKAASYDHIKVVRLLLGKGADVNAKNTDGQTPLHSPADKGYIEVARLLIDRGADVNAKDNYGRTPLSLAAYWGKTDVAELLISKGADTDYAIVKLEAGNEEAKAGAKVLERLKEKQKIASQTQPETPVKIKPQTAYIPKPAVTVKEIPSENIHDIPDFKSLPRNDDLAVIIGIENYRGLPKSDYSKSDAGIVKDYIKALGFQERNVTLLTDDNASLSDIKKTLETWLHNKAKKESKVFIYYSGHGAPEPKTGDAYIVPFDGDPNYLEDTGYSLRRLYEKLGKLQVAEVAVVLDSCFSGAGGRSVLAKGARPLVMMTTSTVLPSNIAVLSATQGSQISTSSSEKGHGVFTYYFLKALKEGKKDIAEIYEYIKPLVEDDAKQLNVQQSPSISPDVEKLKGRFGLRK